jgi:hypothetical protein
MAEQNVSINLDVNSRGNASANMKDMARVTSDAAKAEQQYQSALRNRISSTQAAATAEKDLARLEQDRSNRLGVGVQKALIAVASVRGVEIGLNSVAHMADIASDSMKTNAQRMRGVAESISILGTVAKAWNNFIDAVTGTTEKLRRIALDFAMANAGLAAMGAGSSELRGLTAQQDKYRARALSLRDATALALTPMPFDESRFGEQEATTTAHAAHEGALRASKAARIYLGDTTRRVANSQRYVSDAQVKFDRARDAYYAEKQRNGGTDRGAVAEAANQMQFRHNQLLMEEGHLREELKRHQEASLDAARQESEVRKSLIGVDQARLGILKQQEGIMRTQAQRFGMMNPAERAQVFTTALQAKAAGFESLTPAQKSLLQSAGFGE